MEKVESVFYFYFLGPLADQLVQDLLFLATRAEGLPEQ